VRRLAAEGYDNLITRTSVELDLRDPAATSRFFRDAAPDYVFLAAARVGGILANSREPADFIRDNLLIQTNVIDAAYRHGVRKLLFLGSSCIYPKLAPQPIREEYLLSGPLEPTNDAYAIAKIAGIRMLQAYREQHGFCGISLMPTNLYGPGDNFDPERSHVLAALLRRFHEAKLTGAPKVTVWGTGEPMREFLHVDDFARAAVLMMKVYNYQQILNVGAGEDIRIRDLAALVSQVIGYSGPIEFDRSKPDGTPRKLLDIQQIRKLGWTPAISLRDGLHSTYAWYLEKSLDQSRLAAKNPH
jgi:GDP-L-fucose synthase